MNILRRNERESGLNILFALTVLLLIFLRHIERSKAKNILSVFGSLHKFRNS